MNIDSKRRSALQQKGRMAQVAKQDKKAKETKEKGIDEVVAEEVSSQEPVSEENTVDETEALREKNKELEDKLLRQMAEFDNFRKRTLKEKEEIGAVAKTKCISELLPVLDNFERALQTDCGDADFKKGVEMIFTSLKDTLGKMGVEEIEAEGQPFDPELHYAVSRIEDESLGENIVANVLQKGYKMGEKVIRHAMVAVANP